MCRTPDDVQFFGRAKLPASTPSDDMRELISWLDRWREDAERGDPPSDAGLIEARRIAVDVLKRISHV